MFWTGAVFLCASLASARGACVKGFQEVGVDHLYTINVQGTWEDIFYACFENDGSLVSFHTNVTEIRKVACDDGLVAVDILGDMSYIDDFSDKDVEESDWDFYEAQKSRLENGGIALNVTTGKWHLVKRKFKFSCAICERDVIATLSNNPLIFDSFTIIHTGFYQIALESLESYPGPAEISGKEEKNLINELNEEIRTSFGTQEHPVETTFRSSTINADGKLVLVFHCNIYWPNNEMPWEDPKDLVNFKTVSQTASLQKYQAKITNIKNCSEEKTFALYGREITWHVIQPGGAQFDLEESTGVLTRRECTFNETEHRYRWSGPTYWEIVWKPCSPEEQYENEEKYYDYLTTDIASKHKNILHQYTSSPVNETTLNTVINIINITVADGKYFSKDFLHDLNSILLNFSLINETNNFILSTLLTQVAVIEYNATYLYDGIAFGYELSEKCLHLCPKEPIAVRPTSSSNVTSLMADGDKLRVQLSKEFTLIYQRLTFTVTWQSYENVIKYMKNSDHKPRYPVVNIAILLNSNSTGSLFLDADNLYLEISYVLAKNFTFSITACVAWNDNLGNWTANGCKQLKAERADLTVCHCRGKYFVQKGDKLTAKYALMSGIYENTNLLMSALKDHIGIAVALGLELIVSGLSLFLIILTPILFKKWRDNPGNKILLHMVFALVWNLVLGFTTSLVQFDTEGDGCLTIGVLRHYTFLAMFLWMFVLSGLQLKRLTTIAGAKTTSHLILKVTLFAWGVPLIPIAVLLAVNTRYYRSDRFDRGYCYPEGFVFELTVQAPVGLILFINFLIFIIIVRHIFGCNGEKKITKHSKNERAEKLNRLKTSLFIFILFGFSWVFHFLSELKVINSDFLFEYLFLITTSFHIFMLALFFIVLQDSTRNLWLDYLGGLKLKFLAQKQAINSSN